MTFVVGLVVVLFIAGILSIIDESEMRSKGIDPYIDDDYMDV